MKKDLKLYLIIFSFAAVALFNFFVNRNVMLENTLRYPHPEIWNLDRAPRFEDFPSYGIFTYKRAEVDIYSNPRANFFRSALRHAKENQNVNFATNYLIVEWGCGSTCQDGMILDLISGKVYDVFSEATARGRNYKINSSLIITDPADDGFFDYNLPVRYYIWKDNKLLQIYQEECYPTNDEKYLCK